MKLSFGQGKLFTELFKRDMKLYMLQLDDIIHHKCDKLLIFSFLAAVKELLLEQRHRNIEAAATSIPR